MMLWRMSESPSGLRDPTSWPVAKMSPPPSTISTRSARRVAASSWSWAPSPGRTFRGVQQVPRTMARGRARFGRPFLTPPYFAPDGRDPPAETLVGTAVGRRLLARGKPGAQIPSPPPTLMTSENLANPHDRVVGRPAERMESSSLCCSAADHHAAPDSLLRFLRAAPPSAEPLAACRRQQSEKRQAGPGLSGGRRPTPNGSTVPSLMPSWCASTPPTRWPPRSAPGRSSGRDRRRCNRPPSAECARRGPARLADSPYRAV